MSRLPYILRDTFNEAQQTLFDNITGGKRGEGRTPETFLTPEGGMKGPFNAWFFSPVFGEAVQRLGEVVRFENSIPPPLRELAILVVAAKWQAQYEWWAHEKIARKEGLDPNVIAGLKVGILPDFTDPSEAVVYNFAQELIEQQRVSDQHYAKAVELLGEAGVVELVILLGYYTLVSMSLNVFEVSLPGGETTPFEREHAG
jgi:4-carboxymuconolactone decarboxylase